MSQTGSAEWILYVIQQKNALLESERRAIFDAFYSSKAHGTGLGLLTVKVSAEEHGGPDALE